MATPRIHQQTHTVIGSLADAMCYQPSDSHVTLTADGAIVPLRSKRKKFPPRLKRLRDRIRFLDERLQLDANALRQEVKNLQLNKALLETKLREREARARGRAIVVVRDYFEVFKNGWLADCETFSSQGMPRRDAERYMLLSDRQRTFVSSVFDPSTASAVIDHWRSISGQFGSAQLKLDDATCYGSTLEPVVVATGVFTAITDRATVGSLLQKPAKEIPLASHRNGSAVEYPCRVTCIFDQNGVVVYHNFELDAVLALQVALGGLAPVTRMLHGN